MKKLASYLKIIVGCLLIASSLNLFYSGSNLMPAGIFGLSMLYDGKTEISFWMMIALANLIFLILGVIVLPKKKVKKAILALVLIPALCYLTKDIGNLIDISNVDPLLNTIYAGVVVGLGYRFIYKENHYVSGSDIVASLENSLTGSRLNIINYGLDLLIILAATYLYGLESAMYSLVAIVIIEALSKRASLGTSDSKVFYIITKKTKEVEEYIIDELGYTLTVFDVKGGFLKRKNTVLMSVIPTKDYYKLREGVKLIDPSAFISITDSYETINGNKNKKIENDNI